jgi:RNA polymerase sigma-70 factor (ECF subfamily)
LAEEVRLAGQIDVVLVQKAQKGQDAAFAELFDLLHRPVLNYVYHMLGNRQAAEDITQDAFIRAHARIGQLGPPWDFKSWIFRIASNLAIDHLRRERRFVAFEEPIMIGEPPTTRRPSERGVQQEETRRAVWQTLESMPTMYRQALVLREFNGLSYQELSQALECSYENARQMVHRARLRFREHHGMRMALASGIERCRELGDLLSAYRDSELDTNQRQAVKEHIDSCPYCRETEKDLKKVGVLIGGLAPIWPSPGWAAHALEQMGMVDVPTPAGGAGHELAAGGGKAVDGGVKGLLTGGGWTGNVGIMAFILAGGAGLVLLAAWLIVGALLGPSTSAPVPAVSSPAATPSPTVLATQAPSGDEAVLPTETPSVTPTPTPTATVTPTSTATPTPTPTLGPPMVMALKNSNCRFGPGSVYDVIGFLLDGQTAPIEGRNAEWTWWWIMRQDGPGHCWVWDPLVEVSGDTSGVPVIPAPPTPTPEDTTPPTVTIEHSPTGTMLPDEYDVVTFRASAEDAGGVSRIEIWLQAPGASQFSRAKACTDTTICLFNGGPYTPGTLMYFAKAWDMVGNMAESSQKLATVYGGVK